MSICDPSLDKQIYLLCTFRCFFLTQIKTILCGNNFLTELVVFCSSGILGSVLAKEGRLPDVSNFVSGAFKVLI
jgi:hypothetical protein